MAGRMNLISETEAKGMNTFVGTFSLPSLIFMSLAQLDLSSVNWLFLAAILIAKAIVFFSVIAITLLVGRPINLGRAGIFAIFCTQSNDFAIGYPIGKNYQMNFYVILNINILILVVALYKNTHPDYASYLYLMAPISLAILNPIAFILMEVGKRRNAIDQNPMQIDYNTLGLSPHKEKLKVVISVAKEIFSNPIIFMTILGIIGNLIFSHNVPKYFGGILEVIIKFIFLIYYLCLFLGFRFCFFSKCIIFTWFTNGWKNPYIKRCYFNCTRNNNSCKTVSFFIIFH